MPAPPPIQPASPRASRPSVGIVDRQVDRLLTDLVHVRVLLLPLIGGVVLLFLWLDPTPWRRWSLVAMLVTAIVAFVWSSRRARSPVHSGQEVKASIAATGPLQLLALTLTGGLDSPLVVFIPPYMLMTSVLLGGGRWLASLVVVELLWVATMMWIQGFDLAPALTLVSFGDPTLTHRVLVGAVLWMGVIVSAAGGMAFRVRLQRMVSSALHAQEEQLQTLISHSGDLEVAGGELAHELKNPLASIQGLATLVSRELQTGKGQERMAVLQAEVRRMSSTLEEFLTFSRPMTPVTCSDVPVRALIDRVRDLHEGMAVAGGVSIRTQGQARRVHADVRKLRQALVNLVQNALAVSRPGTTVEISVEAHGSGVAFEVRDRGPGVPDALGDQVFRAGVTTRPGGSGLGLTVARTLARHHGGDVKLLERPGGGTIARMEIP